MLVTHDCAKLTMSTLKLDLDKKCVLFECAVCYEDRDVSEKQTLGCGHSFCKACIGKIEPCETMQGPKICVKKFRCPICRKYFFDVNGKHLKDSDALLDYFNFAVFC